MLGLPHISAKSCYPLAYHSSQPRVATLWPTTVSVTTTLDLPSINYRVLIIPKHPHYIHIITCLFQNIFLSTHTTFIFINNSISINTFQFQQHPFIITIPNSITYNSITYIFTNKFYNHKCNQTQQSINLSSQGSSVSRILTLGCSHTNSDDFRFNSQSTTKNTIYCTNLVSFFINCTK
jgi:hypothetical protein